VIRSRSAGQSWCSVDFGSLRKRSGTGAIVHSTLPEPWKTWAVLADIEADAGNPSAAAEAKRKAIDAYIAYRRDGGENHYPDGRLSLAVTETLRADGAGAAAALLHHVASDVNMPARLRPFVQTLQAVVAGSRDRSLADAPGLDHTEAAEILLLIESLERN